MTPLAAATSDLDFLDGLKTSDDVWVQCSEEGRAVAGHIIESGARIVVLYGPARGSTDFMRRWVVPALEQQARVVFHERCEPVANADPDADIELWDGFEAWISDPDSSSQALLDYVARSSTAHKSVLILQEDYLNRLFQLRGTVPAILDDLFEIPPMPAARFIDAVERTASRFGLGIEDTCRAALARDLDAVRTVGALGPELVAILAFEILRVSHADPLFATAEYHALGGLKGILGRHIDFLMEHVPGGHEAIGWAVLQRAARAPVDVVTDLTDVAHRFDVPIELPQQVLAWLEHDRGVLSENTSGGHDIVPGLLGLAVAAHAARLDELTESARGLLRHGVRQFAESGGLLTDQQFRRINEQRSALTTTEDEATLMLRCALGHSEAGNHREIEHWLRRVRSETTKIEILVDMLFDIRPELRARAAACLRQFDTPDVRAQLHLVALRESDDGVRAAAVDSLGVLRTREVRSDLIRETRDPDSPFQLQAIDALRVFPEKESVDALVQIVSAEGPGHDRLARGRAITALGAQNTDASRRALVQIALEDPDADDREAAVAAIGAAPTKAAAAHILETVSDAGSSPAATEERTFWGGVRQAARLSVLAAAAVIANTFLHGLLLITIGARRPGIVITIAEAVIVALAFASPGLELLWFVSWVVGYLMPTRMLLRRRTDGDPMTPYECAVGRALFIVGCVTGFLVVHGLPSMLTRHVKRGLMLTAFEVAGLVLILLSRSWAADLGLDQPALREVFWHTDAATWLLFGMGVLIFATTYVLGIRTAAADLFTSRKRRTETERRDAIYQGLLPNPHAVAVVVNELGSPDTARADAATALCERYSRILRPALRARWTDADEALRARIAAMISRQPDQASIELLQGASATRSDKRRATRAMWKLRLAIWPPVARAAVLIGLVTLAAYVVMLHEMNTNSPNALLTVARQRGNDEDAVRAITTLGTLARSRLPQVEEDLAEVINNPSHVARRRRAAIDALQSLGTAEAGDALRHFVEQAAGDRAAVDDLKIAAIEALGRIQTVWALSALKELEESSAVPDDLKYAARRAAATIDPLVLSEYYLERSDFETAIQTAKIALTKAADAAYGDRAASALANVHVIRGLAAYERGDYAVAMRDLTGALDSRAPATSLGGAIALAQQLGYKLHETVALVDPEGYEGSYRAYKSVELISRHFGEAFAIEADGNLAESALTTGRFDEALRLARSVAARAELLPESAGTVVPMRIVEAAALALKGDEAQATKVLESLQAQKSAANLTWQYDGTVHYLISRRLSPQVRHLLLAAIRRATNPTAASE